MTKFELFMISERLESVHCGEDYDEFSSYPCDVCDSRLAGARHEVIGLTRDEQNKLVPVSYEACVDCYYAISGC